MQMLTDWNNGHWSIFIATISLIAIIMFIRKGRAIELALFSLIFQGFMVGFMNFPEYHPTVAVQLKLAALKGGVQFGILSMFFFFWNGKMDTVMRLLFWLNLGLTFLCWFVDLGFTGLGLNISLNGTLIALLLAYELDHHGFKTSLLIALVAAVAVMLTGTSMGLLAITCGIVSVAWASNRVSRWMTTLGFIGFIVMVVRIYGEQLWSLSNREKMWALMLEFMGEQGTWLIGSGTGTFAYLGPKIQDVVGWTDAGYFYHAHSDILQVLFENGILGVTGWVIIIACGFFVSIKKKSVSGTYFFMAFAISCVGNFPMRLPLTALALMGMLHRSERR